jgi:hypothetical protein
MGAMPGARGTAAGPDFNRVLARIAPLLRLDTSVFRELYGDQASLIPSIVLAFVSLLLMALGSWLWFYIEVDTAFFDEGRFFVRSVLIGSILATALWAGWVYLAGFILNQTFKRTVNPVALLSVMGLATLPFAFGLLMLIDPLRQAVGIGAVVGAVVLSHIAIQETTDATPGEVFAANMIGFLAWALLLGLLGGSDRDFAPGIWLFA